MDVYFNHDGGVDDLVSLLLLLQMEDVNLIGVGVIGADSYVEPAVSASQKIISRFGHKRHEALTVSQSDSRGKNPFPIKWRMDAFSIDALPILNEYSNQIKISNNNAVDDLINKLSAADNPVTLLFTGPLTDLARAIQKVPSITEHIDQLLWMGGSFGETGNVDEPSHDGSAEWNVFWDPEAFKTVLHTTFPIRLVSLESTIQVPLTSEVRTNWALDRQYPAIDFIGQGYALVPPLVHLPNNSTYYLWDVLTTCSLIDSSLVDVTTIKADVVTTGISQGKTFITSNGRDLSLVSSVINPDLFFKTITNLAKLAPNKPEIKGVQP